LWLPRRGDWWLDGWCSVMTTRPNHALQRTRLSRPGCNRTPSWAGSLSLGR
jgi:hypothetical protein